MGWVQMSKRDLQRVEVLTQVLAGRRTTKSAAAILEVSLRQEQPLLAKYKDGDGASFIHRSRGRTASNRLSDGAREYVLKLVQQSYRDFGPTLGTGVCWNGRPSRRAATSDPARPHCRTTRANEAQVRLQEGKERLANGSRSPERLSQPEVWEYGHTRKLQLVRHGSSMIVD